ncbi:P-type conjugative transfer protein TrbJ [Stenotrophomonas acidaminiphila]|uniref:P-type conjugative transfer protein TrbJ n=1 Tax=Stenotrophomonas acidaminiphila TaxID=128780 RepID=UPI0015FB38F5|nr:P-type conjugative transfer protein TrbJ [Stenotrophomonas acidaminiphila]
MKNTSKTLRNGALSAALTFMVGSFFAVTPRPAEAIVCANCSTVWNQMLEYGQALKTAVNTAQQLQTQIRQYADMVKQGISLPASMLKSMQNDIAKLRNVYNDARMVAHSMKNLDKQFKDQFKGYKDYLKGIGDGSANMTDRYQKWADEGFDNARLSMEAAGINVSSFEDEDAMLRNLINQSQSAEGRLQAIQAGNEIAAQQVQQIQKLRELVATTITLQSNFIARETERQAVNDAAMEKFFEKPMQFNEGRRY